MLSENSAIMRCPRYGLAVGSCGAFDGFWLQVVHCPYVRERCRNSA